MAQTGPITKDTSSLALGLAKVRVGTSATFIGTKSPCLSGEANSVGALANTKFVGSTDWYRHQSGFPLLEDYVIALRDSANLECAMEELSPFNFALAMGIDPTGGGYTSVHSGEIALGARAASVFVRMEAEYTFPNGSNKMTIVFPKAQAVSNVEFEMQKEDAANVPITFESKRADTNATWTAAPLGCVIFT